MYSIPHLKSEKAVDGFIAQIEASDELARLVRVIFIPTHVALEKPKRISVPLSGLLRVDRRIQVLTGLALHGEGEAKLQLQSMEQDIGEDVIDSKVWTQLTQLKNMVLFGRFSISDSVIIPADAFPCLESLELWGCDASMFEMFTQLEYVFLVVLHPILAERCDRSLPSLQHFGFSSVTTMNAKTVLEVHGAKLISLAVDIPDGVEVPPVPVLDLCPHIEELRIMRSTPVR